MTMQTTPNLSLRSLRWPLVALFGALLADLTETFVDPVNSGDTAKIYAGAASEGRMIASVVCLLLTSLVVPGVWGLTRPLVGRGRILGRIAACLALMGALGHAALSMLYLVWTQVPKGGVADRAEMIGLLERVNNAGITAIVFPLIIAFPLAFVAFYGSYVRARIVSVWALVPVVAAPVCAIAAPGGDKVQTSLALAFMLVAATAVALGLRSSTHGRVVLQPAVAVAA